MTSRIATIAAAFSREIAAQQLNRFLHGHLGLAAVAGLLPLFTPGEPVEAAPLWALPAVLYCLSLSALLLGLSSAHGDGDEYELLFAQPVSRPAYLLGKVAALAALLAPAALLLVLPAALLGGLSMLLIALSAAAAGLTIALATGGLAIGLWVRDHVRGLLAALGLWFVVLFAADLLLLAFSGAPWTQAHRGLWVAVLMTNPFDAFRVTVLFAFEQAAFADVTGTSLAGWWLNHAALWLAGLLSAWTLAGFAAALAGANRRIDA